MKPLPDIDEIEPLGPSDEACLQELRNVLDRHGALERFGITLLHDHFSLSEDEMLIEECDEQTRTLTIQPVSTSEDAEDGEVIQTNWRFPLEPTTDLHNTMVCKVGCFSDLKDNHRRTHDRVKEL